MSKWLDVWRSVNFSACVHHFVSSETLATGAWSTQGGCKRRICIQICPASKEDFNPKDKEQLVKWDTCKVLQNTNWNLNIGCTNKLLQESAHSARVKHGTAGRYVTSTFLYSNWIWAVLLEIRGRITTTKAASMVLNKDKKPRTKRF